MIAQKKIIFLVLALMWATAESTKKESTKKESTKEEYTKKPKCGANEVYNSCGSACPTTCKTRFRGPEACIEVCVPGCSCVDGYFKHDNGTCVPLSECSPPKCNKDEQYTQCGTACQKNCDNNDNTCLVCTKECVEGCFCKDGTIRESADSLKCIKSDSCPVKKCPGDNQVWDKCPPNEHDSCCEPQCRCKPGYYKNDANICISTKKNIDSHGAVDKKWNGVGH